MNIENFVIDPPWPRKKGGLRSVRPRQNRNLCYNTLGLDDIFSIIKKDIFTIAAPIHNIFLWGIDKYLFDGEKFLQENGYKLHARLIWNKCNGIAPAFTIRYSHEYISWFYKPKLLPIDKSQRGKFSTIITEKSREHSRKPDMLYNIIELLYPNSSYMDVFSREKRDQWLQYGNEVNFFNK